MYLCLFTVTYGYLRWFALTDMSGRMPFPLPLPYDLLRLPDTAIGSDSFRPSTLNPIKCCVHTCNLVFFPTLQYHLM